MALLEHLLKNRSQWIVILRATMSANLQNDWGLGTIGSLEPHSFPDHLLKFVIRHIWGLSGINLQ